VLAAFERMEQNLERPAAEHLTALRELRGAVKQALAENEGRVPISDARRRHRARSA
jgi:hypothetical protein